MLTVKYAAILDVTDGSLINFRTQPVTVQTTTEFSQELGATVLVPINTINQQIYSQNIDQLQMVFLMADQELAVRLVPTGGALADTPALVLLANKPSLLSVKNIMEIYVTNSGTATAKLSVQAVGNDL